MSRDTWHNFCRLVVSLWIIFNIIFSKLIFDEYFYWLSVGSPISPDVRPRSSSGSQNFKSILSLVIKRKVVQQDVRKQYFSMSICPYVNMSDVVRKFNIRKFNHTWLNFLIIKKFKLNFWIFWLSESSTHILMTLWQYDILFMGWTFW